MVTLVVRRCSPFHKTFRNCRDEGKRYENLIESFQKTQISKIQTIQPKIPKTPGRKSQGTVLVNFSQFLYSSRGCPLFQKFLKIPFFSPLKMCGKFKLELLLEWKAPRVNLVPRSHYVRLCFTWPWEIWVRY